VDDPHRAALDDIEGIPRIAFSEQGLARVECDFSVQTRGEHGGRVKVMFLRHGLPLHVRLRRDYAPQKLVELYILVDAKNRDCRWRALQAEATLSQASALERETGNRRWCG
jgi:hypothetical protein